MMANKFHGNLDGVDGKAGPIPKRTAPASPTLNMKSANWPGVPGKASVPRRLGFPKIKQHTKDIGL